MIRNSALFSAAVGLLCLTGGCGSKAPPRTIADILRDRENVPYLYLTEKTNREVFGPLTKGRAFVDPESGEITWMAYSCSNPECPGKNQGRNGRPFLFTWRDPSPRANPDGTVMFETARLPDEALIDYLHRLGGEEGPTCPACLTKRTPAAETPKQKLKYNDWVQIYIPPEQIQRAKELDAEIAAWNAKLKERSERKVKQVEP